MSLSGSGGEITVVIHLNGIVKLIVELHCLCFTLVVLFSRCQGAKASSVSPTTKTTTILRRRTTKVAATTLQIYSALSLPQSMWPPPIINFPSSLPLPCPPPSLVATMGLHCRLTHSRPHSLERRKAPVPLSRSECQRTLGLFHSRSGKAASVPLSLIGMQRERELGKQRKIEEDAVVWKKREREGGRRRL